MKVVKQYRYTGQNDTEELNFENLTGYSNGTIQTDRLKFKNTNIRQLGIQAIPGTQFYINETNQPAVVGLTGIFEVKSTSNIQIYRIRFDKESIENIRDNPSAILLIDTIEEGGENI